jgi:hypothetical protein
MAGVPHRGHVLVVEVSRVVGSPAGFAFTSSAVSSAEYFRSVARVPREVIVTPITRAAIATPILLRNKSGFRSKLGLEIAELTAPAAPNAMIAIPTTYQTSDITTIFNAVENAFDQETV